MFFNWCVMYDYADGDNEDVQNDNDNDDDAVDKDDDDDDRQMYPLRSFKPTYQRRVVSLFPVLQFPPDYDSRHKNRFQITGKSSRDVTPYLHQRFKLCRTNSAQLKQFQCNICGNISLNRTCIVGTDPRYHNNNLIT